MIMLIIKLYFSYDLDRLAMDRRRLEKAHLQYAILVVRNWYSSEEAMTLTPGKIDEDITRFTVLYHSLFMQKYASKYQMFIIYIV